MAYSMGPNIVKDGLVFYVDAANKDSYPGSGNNCFNLVNLSHTGSLLGDTTTIKNPTTFVFDHDNDNDKISFQIPSTLNLTTALTLEAWINQEQLPSSAHGDGVISVGNGSSSSGNYEFITLNNKSIYFRMSTSGTKVYNPTDITIDLDGYFYYNGGIHKFCKSRNRVYNSSGSNTRYK